MADEYIKKADAIDCLHFVCVPQCRKYAQEELKKIPAADVAPIRHGRWVKTIGENGVTSACRCNLCGFEDNRYLLFNYCPNCGCAMEDV